MTGDFATLTQPEIVSTGDAACGHRIVFDDRSAIWSVHGGYLAAAALRAAGQASSCERPMSLSIQFLRAVAVGEMDLCCEALRRANGAECQEVRLQREGKLMALAHVWAADGREGPRFSPAQMPPAPHPDELRPYEETLGAREAPRPKFFEAFEDRPINRVDPMSRRNREARSLRWLRYRDMPVPDSPYLRAALTLPLIDLLGVSAASIGYGANIVTSLIPTVQLSVHFYDLSDVDGWLLGDAHAEHVADGIINSRVRVWSERGALVAQGLTQMISKPGEGAFVQAK